MYNHNKAQQSKNRAHISWDILYSVYREKSTHAYCISPSSVQIVDCHRLDTKLKLNQWWLIVNLPPEAMFSEVVIEKLQFKWIKNVGQYVISKASWVNQRWLLYWHIWFAQPSGFDRNHISNICDHHAIIIWIRFIPVIIFFIVHQHD